MISKAKKIEGITNIVNDKYFQNLSQCKLINITISFK